MARGVDGCDIFTDDHDRTRFLNATYRSVKDSGAKILAYCLMGNHFHFAIKVAEPRLSVIIQRLLTGYVLYYNRRHARTGHLFQARYKAFICLNDRYLATLVRYIHMNPVKAGLVLRPEDWPWSSFRTCETQEGSDSDLIDFDPWPKETDCSELLRANNGSNLDLDAIGADIALRSGVAVEHLRSGNRRRHVIEAKRILTREAVRNGHALGAIARWLGVTPSTMTRYFGELCKKR